MSTPQNNNAEQQHARPDLRVVHPADEELSETEVSKRAKEEELRIRNTVERGDTGAVIRAIRAIAHEDVRTRVARAIFGQKLAGDIGLVTTRNHPKTDYGNPSFAGSYDLGDK